jgi:thiol-disulfide isomerase/thioredoxin
MGLLNSGCRLFGMTFLLAGSTIFLGCTDVEPPSGSTNAKTTSKDASTSEGDKKTNVAKLDLEEPAEVVDDPSGKTVTTPKDAPKSEGEMETDVERPDPERPSEVVDDPTELVIGDPAPLIAISKWIKGEPVVAYSPDKVFVVEFWATWCGPCLKSMPHIASLQSEYGDKVIFIGVTAEDDATVTEFMGNLAGQGDKTWSDVLTYRIALDDERKTNERFMDAAGQGGIPCAFIVGKSGNVEWIGHPVEIDGPLKQIVDGSWDSALAKKSALESKALEKALRTVGPQLDESMAAGDIPGAIALVDDLLKKFPGNSMLLKTRFKIAMQVPLFDEANKSAKLIADGAGDDVRTLDDVAWMLATATEAPGLDLDLALTAIKRAAELTKEQDISVLETFARVHFRRGSSEEAIAVQKKAVDSATDPAQKQQLAAGLEKYQASAKGSGKEKQP